MDFGGPGLGNQAFFMVKTNDFGQPPYALPGAEDLAKYAKNLGKTEVFTIVYSCSSSKSVQRHSTSCIILWKNHPCFVASSSNACLHRFWGAFGLIGTGLGLQVGAMLAQVGSQLGLKLRFLASFERSWRLELVLNFNKSRFASAGDRRCNPGGLPARFWRPPEASQLHFGGL